MKKKLFENGTLKSKAYFMNGDVKQEVEEAVYEGKTPLSAENINEMQDNIEEEIDSHIEHRYSLTLTANVAKRWNNNNTVLLQGAEPIRWMSSTWEKNCY